MGGTKPLAELGGRPLVLHVVEAALAAGLDPVVVAKRSTALPAGLARWDEPDEPTHPLLGIATALGRDEGDALVVVAGDMPFVSASLLADLAVHPHPGAVIVRAGDRLQPLIGRYPAAAAAALLADALAGRSATAAALALAPAIMNADAEVVTSVDTPAELRRAHGLSKFSQFPDVR